MLLQGYVTSDIQDFSGSGPPFVVSYVQDNSGADLLLNVSIAYPGSADQASQVCRMIVTLLPVCAQRVIRGNITLQEPQCSLRICTLWESLQTQILCTI